MFDDMNECLTCVDLVVYTNNIERCNENERELLMSDAAKRLYTNWGYRTNVEHPYDIHERYEKKIARFRILQEYTDPIFRTFQQCSIDGDQGIFYHHDLYNKVEQATSYMNLTEYYSKKEQNQIVGYMKRFYEENKEDMDRFVHFPLDQTMSYKFFIVVVCCKAFVLLSEGCFEQAHDMLKTCFEMISN